MAEYTSSSLLMISFLLFRMMTTMKICTPIRNVSTIHHVYEKYYELFPIVFKRFESWQSLPSPLWERRLTKYKLKTLEITLYRVFQNPLPLPPSRARGAKTWVKSMIVQ